jgi:hypothetical protein
MPQMTCVNARRSVLLSRQHQTGGEIAAPIDLVQQIWHQEATMATEVQEKAEITEGKAGRFYQNPTLRDQEWERATQAPYWLTAAALAIVGVAFFVGVYSTAPQSIIGWIVGIITILVYVALGGPRRLRARRRLRELHQQRTA